LSTNQLMTWLVHVLENRVYTKVLDKDLYSNV
jgi:hypothetical protein